MTFRAKKAFKENWDAVTELKESYEKLLQENIDRQQALMALTAEAQKSLDNARALERQAKEAGTTKTGYIPSRKT